MKKQPKKYNVGGGTPFTPTNNFQSSWNQNPNLPIQPLAPQQISVGDGQSMNAEQLRIEQQNKNSIDPITALPISNNSSRTVTTKQYGLDPTFQKIDALASGALFLSNSINNIKTTKQENTKYMNELQPKYRTNDVVQNNLPMYAKVGGQTNSEAEVERGEAVQDTEGNIDRISDQAAMHEQGGVKLDNVDRVLENTSHLRDDGQSKKLLISPERFEELFGVKTKKNLSHAKALEEANKIFTKQSNKVTSKINQSAKDLENNLDDKYTNASLDLNIHTLKSIPTEDKIFDVLFNHQEATKLMNGISNPNGESKYGGYIPKYETGGDPSKANQPGYDSQGNLLSLTNIDMPPKPLTQDNSQLPLQTSIGQWNYGKTQYPSQFRNYSDKTNKKSYTAPQGLTPSDFYRPEVIAEMAKRNSEVGIDNDLGVADDSTWGARHQAVYDYFGSQYFNRPQNQPQQVDSPGINTMKVSGGAKGIIPNSNPQETQQINQFKLRAGNQNSEFNEPLQWNDIASPIMKIADNERIGAHYNPVELNKVKLKQYNYEPALEQGRRDYNAAIEGMPISGAGMANRVNAYSQKYNINNQVIGDYANKNVGIENQERLYNANVDDRQSIADAGSRQTFEQQYLGSREAQRQQKMKSFDELFNRISENKKLNREGSLLMKMFPDFNSYGDKNANQRYFATGVGNDNSNGGFQTITDPNSGKRYRVLVGADGKPISSSKAWADNKSVGSKK